MFIGFNIYECIIVQHAKTLIYNIHDSKMNRFISQSS